MPAAFNRAFDASARLVFEVDEKALAQSTRDMMKAARYPKGDSLKNHVDPRTYDYVKRIFALMKVPEEKFSQYRPWFLVLMLQSPRGGFTQTLGVEQFLLQRARANSKPVTGLESVREHAEVFGGLSDRQGETLLLLTFIPGEKAGSGKDEIMTAWGRRCLGGHHVQFLPRNALFRGAPPGNAQSQVDPENRRLSPERENLLCRRGSGTPRRSLWSAHAPARERLRDLAIVSLSSEAKDLILDVRFRC